MPLYLSRAKQRKIFTMTEDSQLEQEQLLDARGAAKYLGLGYGTLMQRHHRKQGPRATLVGKQWIFRLSDLRSYKAKWQAYEEAWDRFKRELETELMQ
jgi:hypothetical protein